MREYGGGGEEGGVVVTRVGEVVVVVEVGFGVVVEEEDGMEVVGVAGFLAPLRIRSLLVWCRSLCCWIPRSLLSALFSSFVPILSSFLACFFFSFSFSFSLSFSTASGFSPSASFIWS